MKGNGNLVKNISKLIAQNKRVFFILAIIIVIILAFVIINCVISSNEYKKYIHYEEKMNSYGFNTLYDNGSAKSSEKVTKSEAIKMAIGVCLNTFDIEDIAKESTEKYENAIWVLYAQDAGLVSATSLNKDTQDDKAKYVEVIEYFAKAKKKLLKEELSSNTSKKLSDLDNYTENEQKAILDMLSNDILKVVEKKLKGNKNIFKGQLNEIVVNYIEKYNLFNDEIETDTSKLPTNASEYAYISKNVAKEVYELPFKADVCDGFISPKESFTYIKTYYNQIVEKIEQYYNTLVNVDYQTTTVESLKSDLYYLTLADASDTDLNEYIDYIKTNQIKISGNAKVQQPIIYYDGSNYRVRTKIEFKVENSNTIDNLLFGDLNSGYTVRYDNKNNSIIADVIMGGAINTGTYYIKNTTLNVLLGNNNEYKIYNPNGAYDYSNMFTDSF